MKGIKGKLERMEKEKIQKDSVKAGNKQTENTNDLKNVIENFVKHEMKVKAQVEEEIKNVPEETSKIVKNFKFNMKK